MELEAKQDVQRRVIAGITALLDVDDTDERVLLSRLEACRLLDPGLVRDASIEELLEQYELTVAGLLQLASTMVALVGNLQSEYTGAEILQNLAIKLEGRWSE